MDIEPGPSCPCGSNLTAGECCGRYLKGSARPATAEVLMRSRYTAYCLGDEDYLLRTWHADTRPAALGLHDDPVVWYGLRVLRREAGGPKDRSGIVEFIAEFEQSGNRQSLHEVSRFRREQEAWFYLDGKSAVRRVSGSKPGRNEPCSCGSGLKYKKCCGS